MYEIEVTVTGSPATLEQFLEEAKEAVEKLNEAWATVKVTLPESQQVDAEVQVREILK